MRKGLGIVGVVLGVLLIAALALVLFFGRGLRGADEGAGQVAGDRRPLASVSTRTDEIRSAARTVDAPGESQILFGDFHVHTTFSNDAFGLSLPILGGQGTHPPADACDFARHCSQLDFFSINDHAESLSPRMWRETIESLRRCAEVGQHPDQPDTVPFLGWEWTQIGATVETHYGHRNVIVPRLDDASIPTRPIASEAAQGPPLLGRAVLAATGGHPRFDDFARYWTELAARDVCPEGVGVRDLPDDCLEVAPTPRELFAKLRDWDVDPVVIPHGTAWGNYTPQGARWDKQLEDDFFDPDLQRLVEVYSGHGSSEVYRSFRAVIPAADGSFDCPLPTRDFLPQCWRAGEIMRARCLDEGIHPEACYARAAETRKLAANAGALPQYVVGRSEGDDWGDTGQCRDCSQPAFHLRPMNSAQYMLARGHFGGADASGGEPRHMQVGFIASSDSHTARAGSGYKEVHRAGMTDSMARKGATRLVLPGAPAETEALLAPRPAPVAPASILTAEVERFGSYLYTGGLIAVHAARRSREAIWESVKARRVYGTSGPRILLWFDLVDAAGALVAPMGAEVELDDAPRFAVRALGSFEQKPGCPEDTLLPREEIERLCMGECYHPGDARRPLSRLEIVRIRPQRSPEEPIESLIDDPWQVFDCEGRVDGCTATFHDRDYAALGRDTVYYARAIEASKPGINAAGIRVVEGKTLRCPDDFPGEDCLAPHEPRAWSSPIFVEAPVALRRAAAAAR